MEADSPGHQQPLCQPELSSRRLNPENTLSHLIEYHRDLVLSYERLSVSNRRTPFFNIKSMAQCKTAVTPLLTHWSYCSLALSRRNMYYWLFLRRWDWWIVMTWPWRYHNWVGGHCVYIEGGNPKLHFLWEGSADHKCLRATGAWCPGVKTSGARSSEMAWFTHIRVWA